MVKLSDKRRIAAHQFWLWEYQRRNSEYKETYDNFMQKLSLLKINYIEVVALPEKKSSKFSKKDWKLYQIIVADKNSFIKKFDREPKDYEEGYNSENLGLINGFHIVAFDGFEDFESATKLWKMVKADQPDAWVMKY